MRTFWGWLMDTLAADASDAGVGRWVVHNYEGPVTPGSVTRTDPRELYDPDVLRPAFECMTRDGLMDRTPEPNT